MMNRDSDLHLRQQQRLMALAETTKPPHNIKRRTTTTANISGRIKSPIRSLSSTAKSANHSKFSLQDFVRNDPGYTPNIEHLVFPHRKSAATTTTTTTSGTSSKGDVVKARSRLAEMFALSRHLQQRSVDRELKQQQQQQIKILNRSMDSSSGGSASRQNNQMSKDGNRGGRRWASQMSGSLRSPTKGSQPSFSPINNATNASNNTGTTNNTYSSSPSSATTSQAPHTIIPYHMPSGGSCPPPSSSLGGSNSPASLRLSPGGDSDRGAALSEHSSAASTGSAPGGSCISTSYTMPSSRGSNVSVLHLRSASEQWDTCPPVMSGYGRSYSSARSNAPPLSKHQSLGNSNNGYSRRKDPTSYFNQQQQQQAYHHMHNSQMNSGELYVNSGGGSRVENTASGSCSRELSPVRWCDREVDGVYLGRSGWVQVQQRSLDENRRVNYEAPSSANTLSGNGASASQSRRATIKLADYHCNSEPGKYPEVMLVREQHPRPIFLPLRGRSQSPSPPSPTLQLTTGSYSPPSITPIISPPPAFQDAKTKTAKSRYYYGTKPFLPRSNAIDSDIISPPASPPQPQPPPINWSTLPGSQRPKHNVKPSSTPSPSSIASHQKLNQYRIPQTKSLEDTTPSRRSQFVQRYMESSSSSSSSMGFRSLDSCVNRSVVMPRLAETMTDSSVEGYEDGDEDEISSSINLSGVSSVVMNSSPESINGRGGNREKISPSGRQTRVTQHRSARRSPAISEINKSNLPSSRSSSSSSSSRSPPVRSPSGSAMLLRRQHQSTRPSPDLNLQQRVRRSRSLQLPDKKSPNRDGPYSRGVSPQQAERVVVKMGNTPERVRRHIIQHSMTADATGVGGEMDVDMQREAEVVTEFLYGSRSRAAAKALLMQRYHERRDDVGKEPPAPRVPPDNGYNVFIVPSNKQRPKGLQRGAATTPNRNFQTSPTNSELVPNYSCNQTCDYWPHCPQRDSIANQTSAQYSGNMRASQSYPAHQQRQLSADSARLETNNRIPSDEQKRSGSSGKSSRRSLSGNGSFDRSPHNEVIVINEPRTRRISPNMGMAKRDKGDLKTSPKSVTRSPSTPKTLSPGISTSSSGSASSSSSSDVWITTSDRTATKSPRNAKSSGTSTPLDEITLSSSRSEQMREMILTRPGSAPADTAKEDLRGRSSGTVLLSAPQQQQQRSMSLPKSFLSRTNSNRSVVGAEISQTGSWKRQFRNSDNIHSSPCWTPSPRRRTTSPANNTIVHTAPVTPLHEVSDRRSPSGGTSGGNNGKCSAGTTPGIAARRIKATSTPHLLDDDPNESTNNSNEWRRNKTQSDRNWSMSGGERNNGVNSAAVVNDVDAILSDNNTNSKNRTAVVGTSSSSLRQRHNIDSAKEHSSQNQKTGSHRSAANSAAESVLQKFRKTFSLRFQKKSGSGKELGVHESDGSSVGITSTITAGDYDDDGDDDLHLRDTTMNTNCSEMTSHAKDENNPEQKYRFGPLIWRSSKERRKKGNKAVREAKCNSGDSGIQIEMTSSSGGGGSRSRGGGGGGGGCGDDSSESHDTDQHIEDEDDDEEMGTEEDNNDADSPLAVRRRRAGGQKASRPHSDLINQILIDKFKADLQQRNQRLQNHPHVRRTNSDLGGQRLLQWDTRGSYRRMFSSPSPIKSRPTRHSPRHAPPPTPSDGDSVQLRNPHRYPHPGRNQLRRSLSQPLDIDKLSPLMRTKAHGLRSHGYVFSEDEHERHNRAGGVTSDDETMSDSESSVASLSAETRKRSLEMAMDEEIVILAEAVWDHVAMEAEELAFRAGDVIEVLETVDKDWWWGANSSGQTGWFPAAFVRLRVSQEDTVEDCLAAMASGKANTSSQLRRRTSVSLLSNEQVRASVVRELVTTERDFVKVLRDLAEGYVTECRRRTDMFTPQQIDTIFINIEELLNFQCNFLKDLESCIDWSLPHRSCVGECFLKHRAGFRMYSDYCNSHPMAIATLQELYQHNSYNKFFEACRLMRGMIEIPLDGYLLTPVQRICKYPLQLAELLKYTKIDHPDRNKIEEALEAMRDVAVLINERKRRMESLEKLAAWQQRVEGWEGEDLIEVSSQLIHQGDVVRVTSGMWTSNITLFLFDHQIIYCKKDMIKRNTYVYKGRICLDTSEIIDVPDGKEPQLGVNVKHGLKIYSVVRDKWLLFCCRSSAEKDTWLAALTDERRLVARDRLEGIDFPPAARQLARLAAKSQRRPPTKLANGKNYKRGSYLTDSNQISSSSRHAHQNSLGRKVGTWFTFGVSKKGRPHHTHHPHHSTHS